ncbi:MAG TPA: FKBP-type peptidyl-prolyl cis-trans isomerase [Bacteroidales bacterium]|nr:FKBP-type peptidyl-prolyl cis-trans isomerase [Bacteroidales bacterium]
MNKITYILLMIALALLACNSSPNKSVEPAKSYSITKQKLMGINQQLTGKDRELIKAYIDRHMLTMRENPSGLFVHIYGKGSGLHPKKGDLVNYYYRISLLDGTECYKSEPGKPKSIVLGHGGVEAGLEEGIRLMRKGQKALFILPPHLAHGLIGDMEKIPPRASIVYEVKLVDVQH